MDNQHSIPPRDAPYPFNQRSADVTLRTSDSVNFHVHAQILSQASPVFAAMFQLPQTPAPLDRQLADRAIPPVRPVVNVTEDSRALDPLLRLCYPVRKAKLQHPDAIQPVLEAAIKYDMEWPTEVLTARFLECAPQGPLQVWAFGCRHGLAQVVQRGAEALRTSIPDGDREKLLFLRNVPHGLQALDGVSAGQYFRLLQFVRAGGGDEGTEAGNDGSASTSTLASVTRELGSSEVSALLMPPKVASTPAAASVVANLKAFESLPFANVHGWPGFSEDLPPPDIICRSEDGTEFKAHQAILSLFSPVLRVQIATMNATKPTSPLPQPSEGEVQSSAAALPILNLGPGPSNTISMLLGICYQHHPQSMHSGWPSLDCINLLVVATKYKIQPAIDFASAQWEALVPDRPHYSYFLARNAAMRGAAAVSGTAVLHCPWKPETWPNWRLQRMENAPARVYHQLAVYYDGCSRAAAQAIQKATKSWEMTAAERSAAIGQPEATAQRYRGVTNWLNRRREALERREVAPKADHVDSLRRSSYSGLSSLEKFDNDLEGLLRSLQTEVDVAINKVKLDPQ